MSVIHKNIVIVGGGFSGTVLALQLLRRSNNVSVAVIDPSDRPAKGLAYGTPYNCHLLNVCSGDMSAFPDEPGHFWAWAEKNWERWNLERSNAAGDAGALVSLPIHPRSFFPRAFYGHYLTCLLKEMPSSQKSRLQWILGEAVGIQSEDAGSTVHCKNGPSLRADAVVFATGNFLPGDLSIPGLSNSRRYWQNAWSKTALADLFANDEILLIGSGLTSVDMAVALHSRGFRGKIHVLSRHGLIPHCHQHTSPWPRFWDDRSPRSTRELLCLIRVQAEAATASGSSWHAVMDSLRPLVQEIWQSLPNKERRRFLRHVRAYWEIHRHRIAPEISSVFRGLMASGQIEVHSGRITNYFEDQSAAEITFRERSTGKEKALRVARIINCSGPELNLRKVGSALLQDLFQQGLMRQDSLGLGLDVSRNGALLDANGRASQQFFALGPARKGNLWETTAVPDLRCQASDLANHLLDRNLSDVAKQSHEVSVAAP